MKKGNSVVLYKSKYGFSKRYAEWIANELKCDIFEVSKFDFNSDYKTIIFGGGLYAGKLSGIDILIKNFEKIKDKNIIVFTVGLADVSVAGDTEHIRDGIKAQMPKEVYSKLKLFHLRGGIDYKKLSFMHKAMMWMMRTMLLKKPEYQRSESDKGIINTYGTGVDFSDKKSIKEIVNVSKNIDLPSE